MQYHQVKDFNHEGVLAMTTATTGTTLCKNRIHILSSNVATLLCESVWYAYRSKTLLGLNLHRQRSISKEDTEN